MTDTTKSEGAGSVRVLFFGHLAEVLGREQAVALPGAGCTLGQLRRRLASAACPEGRAALLRPDVRASLDQVISPDRTWVGRGSEVAFLPVFSGG